MVVLIRDKRWFDGWIKSVTLAVNIFAARQHQLTAHDQPT